MPGSTFVAASGGEAGDGGGLRETRAGGEQRARGESEVDRGTAESAGHRCAAPGRETILGYRLRRTNYPAWTAGRRVPELPEVETTRRGLLPLAVGRRVANVHVYDRRLRWPVPQELGASLAGRRIDRIDRRSKYLLFRAGADTLLVHLGMTGSLQWHAKAPARVPHDHVDIVLDDRSTLRYHDPRRFGSMHWIAGDAAGHPLIARLGPEPLEDAFDAATLHRGTRGRRAAIKLALTDNKLVVGVGNIYASEALFRAGIRPTRAAGRLTRDQCAAPGRRRPRDPGRGHRQGRQHARATTSAAPANPAPSSSSTPSTAARANPVPAAAPPCAPRGRGSGRRSTARPARR